MDEINFDDVPFEKDTEAAAQPADISFDDVPMEEPKAPPAQAVPVEPRKTGNFPAREPSERGYDPFENESWWDTTKRVARTAATSAAETVAGVPEGAALRQRETVYSYRDAAEETAAGLKTKRDDLEKRLKLAQDQAASGDKGAATRATALQRELQSLDKFADFTNRMKKRADEALVTPVEETPGFAMSEQIRDAATKYIGPLQEDTTFTGKLAQGIGSMFAFIGASVIGGRMGGAGGATAVGALAGSNVTSAQLFKEAREAGADERTAMKAARSGAVLGATEVVPILTGLKYLPKPLRVTVTNAFLKRAMDIVESGGEEALQEYLSQVGQNMVAAEKVLGGYDPDRPLTEGALEAAVIGGILGVGTGSLGALSSDGVNTVDEKRDGPDTEAALKANDAPVEQGPTPPARQVDPDQEAALAATQPAAAPAAPPPVPEATPQLPPEAAAPSPAPVPPPVAPAPVPGATPDLPPPPDDPGALGEYIREVARRRQAEPPVTAPQAEPPVVAEGPQAGGPPAAPPSPPITSEGKPPAPPKPVRNFASESAADVLHAAGLKTAEIAVMKKSERGQLTSLIRSALKSQYSAAELNAMPREQFNAEAARVYAEIADAIAAKARPQTPPRPAPVQTVPEPETPVEGAPPVAEEPAAPPPIIETPPEPKITKGDAISEEEKQRIMREFEQAQNRNKPVVAPLPVKTPEVSSDEVLTAEELEDGERRTMPGDSRPKKAQDAVDIGAKRTGRVLADVSEEGTKKAQDAAKKAAQIAAKQEAEVAAVEQRKAKAEKGPEGAKMNPVEVARRQANKAASTEIAQQYAPDAKTESNFGDNTYEGNKAREAIYSRARRMVKAAEERLSADDKGNKLPKSRKTSTKEEQALSAETLLLMEARDLAKMKRPSLQAVERFKGNEALLRSGRIEEYMAARRGDIDTATRQTATIKDEEGDTLDAVQTLPDEGASPEKRLEQIQEGEVPEYQDYTPAEGEAYQEPIVNPDKPKVANEENIGQYVSTPKPPRTPTVVKRRTITSPGKKATPADRAKAVSELRALRKDNPPKIPKDIPSVESAKDMASPIVLDDNVGFEIENHIDDPVYELGVAKMLANDPFYAARLATDFGFFDEMMDRLTEENLDHIVTANDWDHINLGNAQAGMTWGIVEEMKKTISGVSVYVVPDSVMDNQLGKPKASAFYDYFDDAIVIRESTLRNPSRFVWDMVHEGAHAMTWHALRTDPEISAQIAVIATAVQKTAAKTGLGKDAYGFKDVDEFVAEYLSNPEFAATVGVTPLTRKDFTDMGVSAPSRRSVRTVFEWMREVLANALNIREVFQKLTGKDRYDETALDYMNAVVDRLFDMAPGVRRGFMANTTGTEKGKWVADHMAKTRASRTPQFKNMVPSQFQVLANERKAPLSNWNKLMAGGVPFDDAREISKFLKAEVGKSVDPATVPLLIADYIALFGKPTVTSTGNATQPAAPQPASGGGNIQPPYRAPPAAAPSPQTPLSNAKSATRGPIKNWLQRQALKHMTLDFLRQKHRDKFNDAQGNIIDDLIVPIQKKDNLTLDFAKPINEATADYTDLMKAKPKDAVELAELAMEATRLDVRLGPNADNSHLGKNKAKGLQGKRRLAALNQRFDALSPEAKAVYRRLTKTYRDAHNANVEALAYNILKQLQPQLSNSNLMDLMNRTVNGLLDANDAALINDKIVFNALKNAQELKVIKGDYFPQMRFGDFVVLTNDTVTDPKWTSVPMTVGKKTVNVPVKTEVVGGDTLRVTVDPSIRGSSTAANRALREYAAKSDLTLQGITTRYRHRLSGQIVSKGEQLIGSVYDKVYEAKFQTKGVHYFESAKDAHDFRKGVQGSVPGPVLRRENFGEQELISGSMLAAVVNRINSSDKLNADQKKLFDNVVKNAIIASMDGNSARTRYQARRNVQGASKDIARAAVTYGQAAGNFNATLQTQPDIRDAMERLGRFQRDTQNLPGGGEISQITEELVLRMQTIDADRQPWQLMQNIATLSFLDKLLTPSHSIVNGLQPMGTTMPVLGGRYGFGKANVALANAYRKAGAIGATVSGVKNSYIALKDIGRTALNTDDVIGSMRKNLGREYEDLIDRMLEVGAISPDAGQEVAQVIEAAGGPITNAIGRVDRFARQLPNTIEAINRIVTAVATYDLAKGKGKQEAIQEAIDTVFNTQGDYRKKNAPRWMQHPSLSWALQFKKYGQMMYQLTADMWHRSFKGASAAERKVARTQLIYLYLTQASMAGVYGVAGLELIKVASLLLSGVIGDGWDETEEELRKAVEENTDPTIASLINNGLLSTVTQLDFSGRLGQGDLALGFLPEDLERNNIMLFAARVLLGAPGGTAVDWTQAYKEFGNGNWEKGLELAIPVKQVADIIRATDDASRGKMSPYEFAGKVVGFRSLDSAEESRKIGGNIRDNANRKRAEKDLRNDYIEALDRGDRAAQIKAVSAIKEYNKRLKEQGKKDKREYRPMSPDSIRRYWDRDKKNIYGDQ